MANNKQGLTISAIRSKYPQEKRDFEKDNLWGYFVLRRISSYSAWFFLRMGVSANKVTVLSLMSGCIGCGFLASGSYLGMIIGALLLNIWALLDYVDGDIARYTDSCTSYGAFLDSLNTGIMSTLIFLCAGVGAFQHPDLCLNSILGMTIDRSLFLFLGGWSSSFYLLTSLTAKEFQELFSQDSSGRVGRMRRSIIKNPLHKLRANISNLGGLVLPILLLAIILNFLSVFVFLWALIPFFASIAGVTLILREARRGN